MAEGESENKYPDFNSGDFDLSKNPVDLQKGDIGGDITTVNTPKKIANAPPNVSNEQQSDIASQRINDQQKINKIRRSFEKSTSVNNVNLENKLFGSLGGAIIKKIPGIRILLSTYNVSPLKQKVSILEKMRKILKMAKFGASLADASTQCWTFFGFLILPTFGLILIIAVPVWIFMLFLYGIMQESAPSKYAKVIAKSVKMINTILGQLKAQLQREEQRKIMMARLREIEVSAREGTN